MSVPVASMASHAETNSAAQAKEVEEHRGTNWAFRIGLLLGLILGVGWGFLLGVMLVRLNTEFLLIGMILTAVPIAFFGSVPVAFAFHRVLPGWRKLASVFVITLFVAAGMPFGLEYGLNEQLLTPTRLINTTGMTIWEAEWFFTILGLIGGTWYGWTRPVTDRVYARVAPPIQFVVSILRFVISIPGRIVEAIAQFFESIGHGFLWLPLQLIRIISTGYQGVRGRLVRLRTQIPAPPRPRPRRPKKPRRPARKQSSQPRVNENGGPRIVRVVEDRCPYCLDVVKRNDPRGVKVCEVCGTPHHADCWAITGKCQVPHLNT